MTCAHKLRVLSSGIKYPVDRPMNLDPAETRPVEMTLDLERFAAERSNAQWHDPHCRDMRRS